MSLISKFGNVTLSWTYRFLCSKFSSCINHSKLCISFKYHRSINIMSYKFTNSNNAFLACCVMFPWTAQLCLLIKKVLANHTRTLFDTRFAHRQQFYAIRTSQFQNVIACKWHIPICQFCILATWWKIICIYGRKDAHFTTILECHLQLYSQITIA